MGTIKQLRWWAYKILPLAYDDSLSYYEVLSKATQKLNEVIDTTNKLPEAISQEVAEQLGGSDTDIYNNLFGGIINAIATKEADEVTYTPSDKQGGEIVWLGNALYEVVAPMVAGTNYIIGTNIVPVDIDGELEKIKGYICTHNEFFHERAEQNHDTQTYLYWKDKLYRVDADIKVNDIISERSTVNGTTTGQLTLINTMDEITNHYLEMHEADNNLQTQIDGNDGDIENLQNKDVDLQNQITNNNTNINKRVDNIVSQSGNDNTEIVDARTESEKLGKTSYDSLRASIVAQINRTIDGGFSYITPGVDLNMALTENSIYLIEAHDHDNQPKDYNETESLLLNMTFAGSKGKGFIQTLRSLHSNNVYTRVAYPFTDSTSFSEWTTYKNNEDFNIYTGGYSYLTSNTDLNTLTKPCSTYITTGLNPNSPTDVFTGISLIINFGFNYDRFIQAYITHKGDIYIRFYSNKAFEEWETIINPYKGGYNYLVSGDLNQLDTIGSVYVLVTNNYTNAPKTSSGMKLLVNTSYKGSSGNGTLQTLIDLDTNIIYYRAKYPTDWGEWSTPFVTVGEGQQYTKLRDGISHAVSISTINKPVTVIVEKGTYNLLQEFENEIKNKQPAGIALNNGVHVIFKNGAIATAIYENTDDKEMNDYMHSKFNPFRAGDYFTLENAVIKAKNTRYCVHGEFGGIGDIYCKFINCELYFESENSDYKSAIGFGLGANSFVEIDGGRFESKDENGAQSGIYFHNGLNNATTGKVIIKNAYLPNGSTISIIYLGNFESYSYAYINNCYVGKIENKGDLGATLNNFIAKTWNNVITDK